MSDIVRTTSTPLPLPDAGVNVRVAKMEDFAFIDSLQKKHSKAVGWMPRQSLEQKIEKGQVLVAWAARPGEDTGGPPVPLGYCIGTDQYFKRDEVGIIYQMNVVPGRQRGFIGATLLKAMFDRAAYGCRLYCCWCAQDLAANQFWQAMGFVPLAFRAGSRSKGRVHIFWQKRIRAGDDTTPWWFPCETRNGAIREDRIVLPIPPGVHWSEVTIPEELNCGLRISDCGLKEKKQLPGPTGSNPKSALRNPKSPKPPTRRRVQFGGPGAVVPVEEKVEKKIEKPKAQKLKNDPKMAKAARELRDRWLEQVNSQNYVVAGKYDVRRLIGERTPLPMLSDERKAA